MSIDTEKKIKKKENLKVDKSIRIKIRSMLK